MTSSDNESSMFLNVGERVRGRPTSGPLLDWYYVHNGYLDHGKQYDVPEGIELEVQPAQKSEPIIEADKPWENGRVGQVHRLDYKNGKYILHYMGDRKHFCVAESSDGFKWTKPNLGLAEFEGSKNNNIVPGLGHHYVFEDPSASPEERFKALSHIGGMFDPKLDSQGAPVSFQRSATADDLMAGDDDDPTENVDVLEIQEANRDTHKGKWAQLKMFLVPSVSPDGLNWTTLKDELMLGEWIDGDRIARYDERLGKYIAYLRFHTAGRRAIGISESKDFRKLSPEYSVLQIDSMDPPGDSFYHNSYTKYPGREDLHLMFVSIFHHGSGLLDVQLAVSHDGMHWDRPDRRTPIISNGPEGSGESGMIYACPQLQVLPDGRYALAYHGSAQLHAFGDEVKPGVKEDVVRLAMWDKDRLVGIKSRGYGRFTLRQDLYRESENCPDSTEAPVNDSFPPLANPNEGPRQLKLNYRCEPGGWIKAELIPLIGPMPYPDIGPIKNYSFEDCDTLSGDSVDQVVTWKGNDNIARLSDSMAVRIEMYKTTLFSFSV